MKPEEDSFNSILFEIFSSIELTAKKFEDKMKIKSRVEQAQEFLRNHPRKKPSRKK